MERSCKNTVAPFYMNVIEDVMKNLQEHFIEMGEDLTVIEDLKRSWESKLGMDVQTQEKQVQAQAQALPLSIVQPVRSQSDMKQNMLIINIPDYSQRSNQTYSLLSEPTIGSTISQPQTMVFPSLNQHMNIEFTNHPIIRSGDVPNTRKRSNENYEQDLFKPSTSGYKR